MESGGTGFPQDGHRPSSTICPFSGLAHAPHMTQGMHMDASPSDLSHRDCLFLLV